MTDIEMQKEFKKLRRVKCTRCDEKAYGETLTRLSIKKSKTKYGKVCADCMRPQEMRACLLEMTENDVRNKILKEK